MHFDVIIVGAGPAGLACARKLCENGVSTLVIERKAELGPKSCAGGITWSGLLQRVPETLIENAFSRQYVFSNIQNCIVSEEQPLIATVNRKRLGRYMADQAIASGAIIREYCAVVDIEKKSVIVRKLNDGSLENIHYTNLVGADGSSSIVRRHLQVPTEYQGLGINYQIDSCHDRMEWHLRHRYFKNGYGWVFPHETTTSIGAYIPGKKISGAVLKTNTIRWAQSIGFPIYGLPCSSGYINYDYRGWQFENIFLAGDAAGLASALTGEGIFPAIVSGEAVADKIIRPDNHPDTMDTLVRQHHLFRKAVSLTEKNEFLSLFLEELGVVLLRMGFIDFRKLEMA